MPTCIDVMRGDVADALVIAAVVVVFDECPDASSISPGIS
tara:strand:+ start:468 stop:587 length:120 start_codon:yes stop_codon:yes gene_type:complete